MTDLHHHLSAMASMIAEPSRAKILCSLMDGRAYTATELSSVAEVSASTTSSHLAKLESQGFITLIKQGRFRYYRLANEEIAHTLEVLMNLTLTDTVIGSIKSSTPLNLQLSRSCYNHLAGTIAVEIMHQFLKNRWIEGDEQYQLTAKGYQHLQSMGFSLKEFQKKALLTPSIVSHNCLDWSERKFHLAGALGTQLLIFFEQKKWIERFPQTREVIWTHLGKSALLKFFNIDYAKIIASKKP
ncbi:ArsR family transcriptional regulator [Ignatzschineria rhizosphaerae]|uniref:ArsR family transcriptional regulator n=1 Tax=Ignatzschineria rhizosphaerae TaxID=2923279 RepID=A0ABY3XAE2_9GAMM|nr:helix-turn-helix transcriptional regulator [Ignatzschineria rhizosphaerae]UNM96933.1 ArsR family transcriptional regulator [Ignatzschineria rhizosphaerae]